MQQINYERIKIEVIKGNGDTVWYYTSKYQNGELDRESEMVSYLEARQYLKRNDLIANSGSFVRQGFVNGELVSELEGIALSEATLDYINNKGG